MQAFAVEVFVFVMGGQMLDEVHQFGIVVGTSELDQGGVVHTGGFVQDVADAVTEILGQTQPFANGDVGAPLDKPLRPKEEWVVEIEILDIYQQIATAKAVGNGWVDYFHLADVNGDWKIINILYDRPSN